LENKLIFFFLPEGQKSGLILPQG